MFKRSVELIHNFLKHISNIIKYGDWEWGWEMYKDKPMFGIYHTFYDGNLISFHLYKLWICVQY